MTGEDETGGPRRGDQELPEDALERNWFARLDTRAGRPVGEHGSSAGIPSSGPADREEIVEPRVHRPAAVVSPPDGRALHPAPFRAERTVGGSAGETGSQSGASPARSGTPAREGVTLPGNNASRAGALAAPLVSGSVTSDHMPALPVRTDEPAVRHQQRPRPPEAAAPLHADAEQALAPEEGAPPRSAAASPPDPEVAAAPTPDAASSPPGLPEARDGGPAARAALSSATASADCRNDEDVAHIARGPEASPSKDAAPTGWAGNPVATATEAVFASKAAKVEVPQRPALEEQDPLPRIGETREGPRSGDAALPDGRHGASETPPVPPRGGTEEASAPPPPGLVPDAGQAGAPSAGDGATRRERAGDRLSLDAGSPSPPKPAGSDSPGAAHHAVTIAASVGTADRTRRAILRLPPNTLVHAGLRPGDTVEIVGKRLSHGRVMPGEGREAICDRLMAANLGIVSGDEVTVRRVSLAPAVRVALRSGAGHRPPPGLAAMLRDLTVTEGDRIEIEDETGRLYRAEVDSVEPAGAGRVDTATEVATEEPAEPAIAYEGIAGLKSEIAAVHETVESPLRRPDLFRRLGLDPPRGILFTGPPGSGKTLLARAVAKRTNAAFFHVAGPEIMSKHYGESEAALRAVFDAASRSVPAIVFIDEIDAIAPRRGALSGEKQVERRVVAQLLTLLDGLEDRGRIVVMAATNLPDDLDPALRRPGRFDREIAFATPGCADRAEILAFHFRAAPLAPGVDLPNIAARAHGYVGADLAALAREAGLAALARSSRQAGGIEALDAINLEITSADLEAGLRATRPSALRDAAVPDRPVPWSEIGGAFAAKAALEDAVIAPMSFPEAMQALGLGSPRGILLVGPPGTGKTLLVRALATECAMNFISARPASLLRQHLGEAERAVADLFARARATAPTILFLDEIDGLAPRRGTSDAAMDRVVAQLLVELDGLETNRDLVVIAATNRPDALDDALIRPGRFDTRIEVGLPDATERREIVEVLLRGRPFGSGTDRDLLAERMEGWTPAEMAAAVDAAARRAFSRFSRTASRDRGRPADLSILPEDFEGLSGDTGPDLAGSGAPT